MKYLFLFITLSFLNYSCGDTHKPDTDKPTITEQQKEERKQFISTMMSLHDESMIEMETMNNMREELSNLKKEVADEELLQLIDEVEARSAETEEMMMNWMRNYEEPADTTGQEAALQYLEQKRFEIQEVHARMLEAKNILNDAIERSK
jgi:hypothetical protein